MSAFRSSWLRLLPAAGLILIVLATLAATGCDDSPSRESSRRALEAEQRVTDHVQKLGVSVASSRCTPRQDDTSWTCELTTGRGVTVEVRIINQNDETYFETTRGLIDGPTIANRLSQDYTQRLGKPVEATCPTVIQANPGDTAECNVTTDGEPDRTITIKLLDDSTGDYTVTKTRTQ